MRAAAFGPFTIASVVTTRRPDGTATAELPYSETEFEAVLRAGRKRFVRRA